MTPSKILAIGTMAALFALACGAADGLSRHGFCVMNCSYEVKK